MALFIYYVMGCRGGGGGGGQKPGFWLQGRPQIGAPDEEPTYDPQSHQMELFGLRLRSRYTGCAPEPECMEEQVRMEESRMPG